jgi:CRISPR-associated protein Cas2
MRCVICYDVEGDTARTKLIKILEGYGVRVQHSVFEFKLSQATWVDLKTKLEENGFLDGSISLIIYPIGEQSYDKIQRYGSAKIWDEGDIIF